ncbi:MAG: tRNA (adenosine(37)-N6)-threonylcarbamoyltransferase complex dimerization subunit type 1 TsaB [Faecalibacterium sp.]
MITLAIEAAGKTASVAILQDGALQYESFLAGGLTHSETLMPLIDTALAATKLTPAEIDLYGVTAGPGSFTGLRIGLATVKGLAFVQDTPCAAVSTLAALAACHAGEGTAIAALDARRAQVYWAGFDLTSGARLTEDAAQPIEALADFVETCKKPLIFIGDGAALCYNRYGVVAGVQPINPILQMSRAAGVGMVANQIHAQGMTCPPAALLPTYLRLSQAERERAERLAKNAQSPITTQ